jgi:hypothetical protein
MANDEAGSASQQQPKLAAKDNEAGVPAHTAANDSELAVPAQIVANDSELAGPAQIVANDSELAVPTQIVANDNEVAGPAQIVTNYQEVDRAAVAAVQTRFDAAVLKIARLIGRQIAREEFAKSMAEAANDNSQTPTNHSGDRR